MDFLELAEKRYSCRKFSDRKVEKELLDRIVEAAAKAPTAVNKQPFKLFLFETPQALENVRKVTKYTFGAGTVLAVGYREEEGWVRKYDGRCFADVDAAIAAAHILLEVADLGLGTTWVGSFDAPMLKSLEPETREYELIALFPIGYPADDAEPSERHFTRKSREELLKVL